MEYTIQALARLAHVSTRTLRYYDQIGLLRPARMNSSGYRIYGRDQVDRLQQILLYRELDLELDAIKALLDKPGFDARRALTQHLRDLTARRARLDLLIDSVKQSITSIEEGTAMSDAMKFEGFKKQLIDDNEKQYGEEVRGKYGDDVVNESNRKMMNMTKEQYDQMMKTSADLQQMIEDAVRNGERPEGETGAKIARLHKDWLGYTWPHYSAEAHRGLTQMYIDDSRFTVHYDKSLPGCAQFLRDAVHCHVK